MGHTDGSSPLSSLRLLSEFLEASQSGLPNHLSRQENRDHEEDHGPCPVFCRTAGSVGNTCSLDAQTYSRS